MAALRFRILGLSFFFLLLVSSSSFTFLRVAADFESISCGSGHCNATSSCNYPLCLNGGQCVTPDRADGFVCGTNMVCDAGHCVDTPVTSPTIHTLDGNFLFETPKGGKFLFRAGVDAPFDLNDLVSAGIQDIKANLTLLEQNYQAADKELANAIMTNVSMQISTMMGKFDSLLLLLNENITVGIDLKFIDFQKLIDANKDAIEVEVDRATKAEKDLGLSLQTLNDIVTALQLSNQNVTVQHGSTVARVDSLSTAIAQLNLTFSANDQNLTLAVSAEAVRAKAAESTLGTQLTNESSVARAAETVLIGFMKNITTCGKDGKIYGGAGVLGADASGCVTASLGPGGSAIAAGLDCLDLRKQGITVSGKYWIDPNGGDHADAFTVYCEMTIDGGGWTIFFSTSDVGTGPSLVTTGSVDGNPFGYENYVLPLSQRQAVDLMSNEMLFFRKEQTWFKVNHNFGYADIQVASTHTHYKVSLTSSNGVTDSDAVMGWSNFNNNGGGSFGIRDSNTFDHHSSSYYHLQGGCTSHYIYEFHSSSGVFGGYDSSIGLGAWTATQGCDGADGGALVFWVALRGPALPAQTKATALRTCAEVRVAMPSGVTGRSGEYWLDPTGGSTNDAIRAYCDMQSDGGGWTVLYAATGATGEPSIISDLSTSGNPLLVDGSYNLPNAWKTYFDNTATETLFRKNNGQWIKTNANMKYIYLPLPTYETQIGVTVTAFDGTTATGCTMGWSNYNIVGGGDFGIRTSAFDHHSTGYWHLSNSCLGMILYDYGNTNAGYDVNTAVGGWTATASCDSAAGGNMGFYMAIRGPAISPVALTIAQTQADALASCKAIKGVIGATTAAHNALYWIDPNGGSTSDAFQVYCDMTTDGGGWTIYYSATGRTGEEALVSDKIVSKNPLLFEHYNLNLAQKQAVDATATESLFYRVENTWLKFNKNMAFATITTANNHVHQTVTCTSKSGATDTNCIVGWSNYNIPGGGDFGITSGGFDHHSASYWHLNSACANMYMYSASTDTSTVDAGYDVNKALGDWSVTYSCSGPSGGALVFYAALR